MGKGGTLRAQAMLLGAMAAPVCGCIADRPLAAQSPAPDAPSAAAYRAVPYAASGADHPAIQAWARASAAQQAAVRDTLDLQQTSWLFHRDSARPQTAVHPGRGGCVPRYVPAEASLLPPPGRPLVLLPPVTPTQPELVHESLGTSNLSLSAAMGLQTLVPTMTVAACE
jgi:hypothetical protein